MKEIEIIIPELEASPDRIISKRPWSKWEEDVLTYYYGRKSDDAIGKAINRSPHAIREKARHLGLKLFSGEEP